MSEPNVYFLGDASVEMKHKGIDEAVVTHRKTGEKVKLVYNFGENLQAAVEKFGEAVVFSNYVIGAKTALRNKLYSEIASVPKDASDEDIQELPDTAAVIAKLQDWKPSEAGTREKVDSIEKVAEKLKGMSDEDKAKEFERLKVLLGLA